MPSEPQQIVDLFMHGKKPLRVAVGREAAHLPLLLTRMFMGYFGSVVRVLVRTMGHGWHHFSLLGTFVLALLQHDIHNVTILVDRPPQISAVALNRRGDLIEIPAIAECSTGLSDPSCLT